MARRRPIQYGSPVLGGSPNNGLTAAQIDGNATVVPRSTIGMTAAQINSSPSEEDNAASLQRQQDWNTFAADQAAQIQQGKIVTSQNTDDANAQHEAVRVALSKVFGYDPKNAPPMQVLMQRWASQPPSVQAGIIKAGGAQFLDPEQGQAAIQKQTDAHDAALQKFKGQVADGIASGKVQFDTDPKTGKVTPFTWEDDPTLPAGTRKIKVPFTPMQQMALDSAIKDGSVPDAYNQNPNTAPTVPKPLTTAQFQDILDARAATGQQIPVNMNPSGTLGAAAAPPMSTDQMQAILDRRAGLTGPSPSTSSLETALNGVQITNPSSATPTDSTSTMSLSPYNYQGTMQLGTNYEYQNPLQLKPNSSTSVVAAANPVDKAQVTAQLLDNLNKKQAIQSQNMDIISDAIFPTIANTATAIPNAAIRAYNSFMGGPTPAIPEIPEVKPIDQNTAAKIANDLAAFQEP